MSLSVEDYKKLIFEKNDEMEIKEQKIQSLIYKTMPNDYGRKDMLNNYPWGQIESNKLQTSIGN